MCGTIVVAVFEKMQNEMQDRSLPGLQALKGFVRQGGLIKPFWGIDKDIYFQNAIQIGDSILDVANDTVDPSKPPLVFHPNVGDSQLRSIENFTEFAHVAEKYWNADVYPNIYFPELAPIFPVISIDPPKGKFRATTLRLDNDALNVDLENFATVDDDHMFGLSSGFLFKSPYSGKRLPREMEEALFNGDMLKRLQKLRPNGMYRVTNDPYEARKAIESFNYYPEMQKLPENYSASLLKFVKLDNF